MKKQPYNLVLPGTTVLKHLFDRKIKIFRCFLVLASLVDATHRFVWTAVVPVESTAPDHSAASSRTS